MTDKFATLEDAVEFAASLSDDYMSTILGYGVLSYSNPYFSEWGLSDRKGYATKEELNAADEHLTAIGWERLSLRHVHTGVYRTMRADSASKDMRQLRKRVKKKFHSVEYFIVQSNVCDYRKLG